MAVVTLVLIGRGGELDRAVFEVADPEAITDVEITDAMSEQLWTLSVGDTLRIEEA